MEYSMRRVSRRWGTLRGWADIENSNQPPSRRGIFREKPLIRESFADSFQIAYLSLFEQQ